MDDKAVIRSLEGVTNKRTMAFVIAGLLVFAFLIGWTALGFSGRRIWQGTAAMTLPAAAQTAPATVSAPK
jgi:hypothetical protein